MIRGIALVCFNAVDIETEGDARSASACVKVGVESGVVPATHEEGGGRALALGALFFRLNVDAAAHHGFGAEEFAAEPGFVAHGAENFADLRGGTEFGPACFRVLVEVPSPGDHI
jgi:hypothetical protein